MKLTASVLAAIVVFAAPQVGGAQARPPQAAAEKKLPDIPKEERPPAGMCRIWLDDVPAAQQPAPTDCPTAVRNRPAKGRVIFGDDYVSSKRGDTSKTKSPIKGFAPVKPSSKKKPPISFPLP